MRPIASRILLAAGILFSLAQSAHASGLNSDPGLALPIGAGDGLAIKVYPPADGNDVVFYGDVGILTAPTASALTVNGEADVTSLSIGGSGALTSASAAALLSLQGVSCAADQALSASGGTVTCVNIISVSAIGTYSFPSCPGGALSWNDTGSPATSGFVCASVNPPITNTTCSVAGEAFTIFSSGEPSCAQVIPDTPCSTGMVITGFSGGLPTCAAIPGSWSGTFKVQDHIDYGYAKASTQQCAYVHDVTVVNGIITNIGPSYADTTQANYLSFSAPCNG